MIEYSRGVATMSSVLLSLSATTWRLRTMPMPSAARATACATGPAAAAAPGSTAARRAGGCGWNDGGDDDRARRRARRERRRRRRRRRLRHAAGERLLQQRRELLGALSSAGGRRRSRGPSPPPPWSRRSIHFFASSRYAGCGVITSSAFIRSIGTMRRMPASGLVLRSPTTFSSSCHHALHVGVLQREHARRHARHPVDVEHVDRLHQVPKLALGAGQDQQVAQLVGAHRLRVLRERLQDAQHLAHADVAQRDDLHRKARRQRALRAAELRRDVAAHRGGLRHDLVDAALLHHRRAVHAQQRLERGRQRVARDARRSCGSSPGRRPRRSIV